MKNNKANRDKLRALVTVAADIGGFYRDISPSDPLYDQLHEDRARELNKRFLKRTEARRSAMRSTIQQEPFFMDLFEQALSRMFTCLSLVEMFDDEGICIAERDNPETCFLNLFLSDTGNDWFYLKDSSLRFQYANPAMLESLNLGLFELEHASDEDLYDEASCQRLRGLYQQVLGGKSVFQVHTRRVLGESKTFLDVLVPLRNVVGFESHIAGVCRDVTETYHERICPIVPDNREDEPEPEPDDELEPDDEFLMLSPAMRTVMQRCKKVANANSNVLLLGETGVGKDYTARFIHNHSPRSARPFINLDCKAVPDTLLESELFGFKAGAFFGPKKDKPGRLELAEDGTLFINEIGNMPLTTQEKLLTFLDSKSFFRLGDSKPRTLEARLITATNKDLEKEMEEGRFKRDLYFRIRGVAIEIPPLRDRLEDLPLLIDSIRDELGKDHSIWDIPSFDEAQMAKMKSYNWPGNIRELSQLMEAMTTIGPDEFEHHPVAHQEEHGRPDPVPRKSGYKRSEQIAVDEWSWTTRFHEGRNYREAEKDLRRSMFTEALRRSGGEVEKAAQLLGMARSVLHRQLKTMGIDRDHLARGDKA